jgi:transcriptional regulator with XRE-family HTH domain
MIHNQLQAARMVAGLSEHEVAERVGLSLAEIRDFEGGRVTPSSAILIKLGQALNVRVAYFFRPTLNLPMGSDALPHSCLPATPDAASFAAADLTERYRMLQALCLLPSSEAGCAAGLSASGDAARWSGGEQVTESAAALTMLDVADGAAGLAHFEQLVLQAFDNEWVGESKAAELLNMSLPNFYRWRSQQYSAVTKMHPRRTVFGAKLFF